MARRRQKTADRCRFDQPLRGKEDEVLLVPHPKVMQILCQFLHALPPKTGYPIFPFNINLLESFLAVNVGLPSGGGQSDPPSAVQNFEPQAVHTIVSI